MAIIRSNIPKKKIAIDVQISSEVLEQIQQYCKWANIDNINIFIEEASGYMLTKLRTLKR